SGGRGKAGHVDPFELSADLPRGILPASSFLGPPGGDPRVRGVRRPRAPPGNGGEVRTPGPGAPGAPGAPRDVRRREDHSRAGPHHRALRDAAPAAARAPRLIGVGHLSRGAIRPPESLALVVAPHRGQAQVVVSLTTLPVEVAGPSGPCPHVRQPPPGAPERMLPCAWPGCERGTGLSGPLRTRC